MMTNTTVSSRVLGSAWPAPFQQAGRNGDGRKYSRRRPARVECEADQKLAKALQAELKAPIIGLALALKPFKGPATDDQRTTGGSDDVGDISWNVPTVTLRYPSNIPGLPGHNWANAISMATPIAHKGIAAGAKVVAMTMIDLLTTPALIDDAWKYFPRRTDHGREIPAAHRGDRPARDQPEQADDGRLIATR